MEPCLRCGAHPASHAKPIPDLACRCLPHLACFARLQRKDLEDSGAPMPKPLPSLYETISSDEDAVLKTIMQITSGITSIVDKIQK